MTNTSLILNGTATFTIPAHLRVAFLSTSTLLPEGVDINNLDTSTDTNTNIVGDVALEIINDTVVPTSPATLNSTGHGVVINDSG